MSRRLIPFLIGVGFICGIGGARYLDYFHSVRRLETAFRAIQLDMPEEEVAAFFESDGRVKEPNGLIWWEDRLVSDGSSEPAREVWYSPRTTFLFPISFAVTYDRNGKVIGKHRYD